MTLEPVLIAGEWRQPANPTGSFKAVDPTAGKPLPESYPVSSIDDITAAFRAADDAVVALRSIPLEAVGHFLDEYAARIEAAADALVERAARETGLPAAPRLSKVELPRTTGQLRQAAAAVRERSWSLATIDTKANLRSYYGPMGGPVVVFGPNNFPFAFNSVAGGDFVAAIAAGNPVIAKANTGHPGTSRLLAELALEAARGAGLPPGMVQMVYRTLPDVGFTLVSDARVAATGFTGSKNAGLKLKAAADRAGKPIYLEMSSTNPVFVLPRALEERLHAIAKELYDSCAMGAGQFCTRPGLTVVPKGDKGGAFVAELAALFKAGAAGTLLGPSGASAIAEALKELTGSGARVLVGGRSVDGDRVAFEPTLLEVSAQQFLERPHDLQTEAFGTVNTVVVADSIAQMTEVAASAGRQPHRLRLQRHHGQGRRRLHAVDRRAARQGRPAAERQDADGRRGVAGDEPRRPVPRDRPSGLHRGRNPGLAAAVRGAALLRRRPPAPPAARASEQEPDGPDVAARRRQLDAGGRGGVTARTSTPAPLADLDQILGTGELLATTRTKAKGPEGRLPITADMLLKEPSGNLFGMTQDAGMGWNPAEVGRAQFLIVSTQGGLRAEDGSPVALGYHTGHWEIGLLVREAAETLRAAGVVPFAAYVSDPCDGRTQGTTGMFDSLPYRNDAAMTMRRLIRSLPRRSGVMGIATCDKGLPATLLALAGSRDYPGIVVPGGVTLPAVGAEDAGKVQTIGARYAHGLISVDEAADMGCRACGTPGGGCQFLGTAATSQVVAEAFGLTLPHSALAPSGEPIWLDMARRSALRAAAPARRADAAVGDPDAGGARERDAAARGVRRLDEPAAAHPGARARRGSAADRRVDDWIRDQPR